MLVWGGSGVVGLAATTGAAGAATGAVTGADGVASWAAFFRCFGAIFLDLFELGLINWIDWGACGLNYYRGGGGGGDGLSSIVGCVSVPERACEWQQAAPSVLLNGHEASMELPASNPNAHRADPGTWRTGPTR